MSYSYAFTVELLFSLGRVFVGQTFLQPILIRGQTYNCVSMMYSYLCL